MMDSRTVSEGITNMAEEEEQYIGLDMESESMQREQEEEKKKRKERQRMFEDIRVVATMMAITLIACLVVLIKFFIIPTEVSKRILLP